MKYLSLKLKVSLLSMLFIGFYGKAQKCIYVSPKGSDNYNGTKSRPLKSLGVAVKKAEKLQGEAVRIIMAGGTYYLNNTIFIDASNAGFASLSIEANKSEKVIISGGKKLQLNWRLYKNGIYVAKVPEGSNFEQLYVNGQMQVLARYPNFDSSIRVFNGTAADAIDSSRVSKWANPKDGYIHSLHGSTWGSMSYKIESKSANQKLNLIGGWQNNRPSQMNKTYRFVENIFEELDTVNEWYLDKANSLLYYYPNKSLKLASALITVSNLKMSIILSGRDKHALKHVQIKGLHFTQNERTFMETLEPLLRSDWRIYRGGVVLLDGTEDCRISKCVFENVGGNAVMVSGYNKRDTISESHFYNLGANAISIVGVKDAVRSPSFSYAQYVAYKDLDKTPGPKSDHYPENCVVENNLIHDIGRIEKQVAGVEIDIASKIFVRHNSIYNTPRAGINIGDGCFGGNIIEYNDVFNTVLETGDHGAFNSWGRDRYWSYKRHYTDSLVAEHPNLILLDAVLPNILRYNRFQCDHGWDIDLDDGSSNYEIYNNVCLSGGLKLREGFYRRVFNNIMINNTFHPHVWFKNSGDVFIHNIVMKKYAPIGISWWGKKVDENLFLDETSLVDAQKNKTDVHSRYGNPMFKNPSEGDYRVEKGSPALTVGFKNFSMDAFGVQYLPLKQIAEKPSFPKLQFYTGEVGKLTREPFLGGMIKSVNGLGDRSAYGLPDENGVIIISTGENTQLSRSGLKDADVIRSVNKKEVKTVGDLKRIMNAEKEGAKVMFKIFRNQSEIELELKP